ncbi:MAG TPA: hypothetical protein DDY18_02880 [Flavobacterium sp.]|jgi:hypothetical protein|nr:hypothetical protein [Flavobacterium sp.]
MLRGLIKKIVGEELTKQSGKADDSARLVELESENAKLKEQLANSGATKRLTRLKELAAQIPDGAQGMGMIAVIEDGTIKNITLKSKADLLEVVSRAEKGELEVFSS